MKLNNKGQSLVMFVLLIPLLMLILVMVVDIGNMVSVKLELNNINKLVIASGLDNITNSNLKDDLDKLVKENKRDIDESEINIDGEKITIILKENSKSVFGRIVGLDGYEIVSEYTGYMEEEQKVIKKVR